MHVNLALGSLLPTKQCLSLCSSRSSISMMDAIHSPLYLQRRPWQVPFIQDISRHRKENLVSFF